MNIQKIAGKKYPDKFTDANEMSMGRLEATIRFNIMQEEKRKAFISGYDFALLNSEPNPERSVATEGQSGK